MAVADEQAVKLFNELVEVCIMVVKDAHAFIGTHDLKRSPLLMDKYPTLDNAYFFDEKYFDEENSNDVEVSVTIKSEKDIQTAEMYIYTRGTSYKAVTESRDLYASIDKDIDILEGQMRKTKAKKEKMMKDSSIKQITITGDEEKQIENEIIKNAYYDVRPISIEDAKIKLSEKNGSIFYTFINVDTGKVNVIFKLKDSKNFGLIEPAN